MTNHLTLSEYKMIIGEVSRLKSKYDQFGGQFVPDGFNYVLIVNYDNKYDFYSVICFKNEQNFLKTKKLINQHKTDEVYMPYKWVRGQRKNKKRIVLYDYEIDNIQSLLRKNKIKNLTKQKL